MERRVQAMNQSINKAVNCTEVPVKEKHVRSTIIGTFYDKGAGTFWLISQRLPIQENRIVAWKFCHVLHKVLREGHPNCPQQSLRHRGMLINLGKLWVHLQDGYGKLIQLYTNLLVTKITFHERNPNIPGNLQLTNEELENILGNDINIYFQLSVEMFDYMDEVLKLQGAIFDSNETPLSSSMTNAGQCRLAPLIPCIQDSNQLYDFSVKLLFKLHTMLPPDTLSGHRDRFMKQFKLLKKFYRYTANLQYFKNLISIPTLPENPPNFLIQSEFSTYRPPVVTLPPEEQMDSEQEYIATLIDTSETSSQVVSPDSTSDSVDFNSFQGQSSTSELLIQKANLIDNLQTEISRLRNERDSLSSELRATAGSMNDQMVFLEKQLSLSKLELEKEREQTERLKSQLTEISVPKVDHIITAAEEKTKASEEKYQKLKNAYLTMREEHINLLRQNADKEKQSGSLKKAADEYQMKNEALQMTINQMSAEMSKITESHQQNSSDIKSEVNLVREEMLEQSTQHKEEVDKLTVIIDQLKDEVNSARSEIDNAILKHENEKQTLTKNMNEGMLEQSIKYQEEIDKFYVIIDQLKNEASSAGSQISNILLIHEEEKQTLKKNIDDLTEKQNQSKAEIEDLLKKHNDVVSVLDMKIKQTKTDYEVLQQNLDDVINKDLHSVKEENTELKRNIEELKNEYENKIVEISQILSSSQENNERNKILIESLNEDKANIESKLDWYNDQKLSIESELQDLLQNKFEIEESLSALTTQCDDLEQQLAKEKDNVSILLWSSMRCGIRSAFDIIKTTIEEFDNPALSSLQCGPDYLRSLLSLAESSLVNLEQPLKNLEQNKIPSDVIATEIVRATHLLSSIVIQGIATSNTSKDIVFGENMAQECHKLANATSACVCFVELIDKSTNIADFATINGSVMTSKEHINSLRELMASIAKLGGAVSGQDAIDSTDSVEGELANMDKAIDDAARRIEEMLTKSRAADSGLKLEVNEKILDACTSLMAAVRELVKKSRSLQAEIVSLGKGTNTAKEFYKRNHQWTEGLISAAKAVALGANLLLTSADKVVTGGGKLEHVIVASQEIAASTAQLVVASRVRAARGSTCLAALSTASKSVSSCTGAVIATAKSCAQLVEESEVLDLSGLSVQAGRRMEMETRVKVLELEQALTVERSKLASLRRANYQLGSEENGKS